MAGCALHFPPRDGKTLCQAIRGIDEGKASGWKQRQLAVVPQNLIGNGFKHSLFIHGGQRWEWRAQEADDLCNGLSDENKSSRLISFLNSAGPFPPIVGKDFKTVTGLNAVTSTAAFTRNWKYDERGKERTREEKRKLIRGPQFRNITLWLDEAHHVRGAADPNADEIAAKNILGDFVSYAVHFGPKSLRITLATATPYNSTSILDEKTKRHFKAIKRTFSDYLENTATELKSAIVTPVEFGGKAPVNVFVEAIRKAGRGRFHLAFLPPNGSFWRKQKLDTPALVRMIKKQIANRVPWAKVLDATTSAGGKILTAMQGGAANQEAYNVVLACRRGREGLDWLPADFLHVLYMQKESACLKNCRAGRGISRN